MLITVLKGRLLMWVYPLWSAYNVFTSKDVCIHSKGNMTAVSTARNDGFLKNGFAVSDSQTGGTWKPDYSVGLFPFNYQTPEACGVCAIERAAERLSFLLY